jgi:hypothetical protein
VGLNVTSLRRQGDVRFRGVALEEECAEAVREVSLECVPFKAVKLPVLSYRHRHHFNTRFNVNRQLSSYLCVPEPTTNNNSYTSTRV